MSKKIAGFHAVDETLKRLKGNRVGGTVLISGGNSKFDKKFNNIIKTAENIGLKVQNVTIEELNNICSRKVHRGILLVLEEQENISRKKHDIKTFVQNIKTSKSIILLLDNIMDPGNFGAILRSADLFSVDAVVVPSKNSVKLTQTVQQSSSGASAYIPVITVSNLNNAVQILKENDYWVYGAAMKGIQADKEDLNRRIGLVLGNEGKGLKQITMKSCDSLISIPTAGHVDSFNVSVAAGILLYEIRRQQAFFN